MERLEESNKLVADFEGQFRDEKVVTKAMENEELIRAMIQEGEIEFKRVLLTEESVRQIIEQKNEVIRLCKDFLITQ